MVAHPGNARTARAARRLNEPRAALVESHADGTPRRVNRRGVALLREGLRQVRASVGAGGVSTVVEVAPWSRIPEARALLVPRLD